MTEAQIQLQNALTTTFLANLAFLSEYDTKLYYKVDELSRMIENGTYKEKYYLEFIMEEGDFDIYDTVNDKYLYGRKPKKVNAELVRKVEFDKKQSILNISPMFAKKTKVNIDMEKRFELRTRAELLSLTMNDVSEYQEVLKDFVRNNDKKNIIKIEKFIFLGTLLGRHIPKIAQKVDAKMYLVLERNLEIFRLSLFTVDYTVLAQKGAVFSIMDDYEQEFQNIDKFLGISYFDNYLLKFSSSSINIDSYIDRILSTISSINQGSYDYNRREYIQINRLTKYINNYKIPMFKNIEKSCDILKDTPILYIAAGPSLDDNLEWIKKNQNKFFIVTVGSSLKKLLDNDIRVDMVTSVDETEIFDTTQFSDENVSKIDKNTIALMSSITYENVLKKLNQENLFLFEVFSSFYEENKSFAGFSVGELTLEILMNLNPKEIYVIGLDLALNQETGESHSSGSISSTRKSNLNEEQTRDTFSDTKSLIKVKGNQQEEVVTTALFYSSIKEANKILNNKSENLEIYNLSKHGAYFHNTIPKNAEDISLEDLKDIKALKNNFYTYLKDNSKTSLDEKSVLEKEFTFVDTKIKEHLEEIKNTNFKSYDEFLEKVFSIWKDILENKNKIYYSIFFGYCGIFIPYLSYHFNDKKLKDGDKKLKKVADIFASQMTRICEDFKTCLKRVI
ncbi:motility associated factor glycosyltransferase family protein [Aliarcobacter skirrowii]|uniref:motility associated factor glycosyltransferase family protein n=1 Tax=Aliarcobacter skirrowii TaxID=28200 RepID=UPI00082BA255|nr:6-hydroxymethylpterin diphosphokinase MptE-like protein [Aliarcobacter skirrowii]